MSILKIDWILLASVCGLLAAGLIGIFSIDHDLFYRQLAWTLISLLTIMIIAHIHLRPLLGARACILGIYFFSLALLIITYFIAGPIHGARSWIEVGPLQIQSSEFMKVALIILFSSFFAIRHIAIARLQTIVISCVYLLIPLALVLIQPDLGTALILFGIWFGYLLVSE